MATADLATSDNRSNGRRSPSDPMAAPLITTLASAYYRRRIAGRTTMATPYDTDLDRNAANYQPLTPLSFLERAANGLSRTRPRSSMAAAARPIAEFYARAQTARLGAGAARHQARRHGLGHARQHAGDARGALRRADDRRRAQHAQHAARCRHHRLHARPRRDQGADHRPRVLQGR